MDVSIIIPVYKQWESLPKLLASLSIKTSKKLSIRILIIDNEPTLNQNRDIEPKLENLELVNCFQPGSYAARNEGLKHVDGELIIFTDADCEPDISWLESMIDAYEVSDKKNNIGW
jgi:glycosyltransferase involved in cell wall biosynthesis